MKKLPYLVLFGSLLLTSACWYAPDLDTQTFALRYLNPSEAQVLIEPYVFGDRERRPGPGTLSAVRGALTVRETADNLDRIARVLEEFDRPQEDLRLYFQIIEANGASTIDPAIASVVGELQELFRFDGYKLLAEAVLTTIPGSNFQQSFTGLEGFWRVAGSVYRPAKEEIWLENIQLGSDFGSVLETSVTIRPGQTLVLGSGPLSRQPGSGSPSGTIILTVRADIVH